jgi:gamma-glutamyltranspeptidase
VANANAPGKRPLANVSPVLVLDEEQAHLSLGATAGRTIIAALPQIVSTVVEHGMGDPAGHQRAQSRLQRAADAGWQPDRSSSG